MAAAGGAATAARALAVAGVLRRIAGGQLLDRQPGDAGANADPRPVLARFSCSRCGGNVSEITSIGTAIQGSFRKATATRTADDPVRDRDAGVRRHQCALALLQCNDVVVNAEPLDTGRALVGVPAARFWPDDPLSRSALPALAAGRQCAERAGAFGRSRARRYQPAGDGVTFADVAGIDEAKEELSEIVDFLRQPQKYQRLGGRIPHGVLLSGPPAPARRCSRGRSPARRRPRSSRWPHRSSSRRSWASALLACVTSSRRRRMPRRRSCSSTSSTPSAGRAPPGSPVLAAATMSASRR